MKIKISFKVDYVMEGEEQHGKIIPEHSEEIILKSTQSVGPFRDMYDFQIMEPHLERNKPKLFRWNAGRCMYTLLGNVSAYLRDRASEIREITQHGGVA